MILPKRNNLVLTFQTGIGENGKAIKSTITIPALRLDLTDDEILQVSQAFQSLVKHPLVESNIVKSSLVV